MTHIYVSIYGTRICSETYQMSFIKVLILFFAYQKQVFNILFGDPKRKWLSRVFLVSDIHSFEFLEFSLVSDKIYLFYFIYFFGLLFSDCIGWRFFSGNDASLVSISNLMTKIPFIVSFLQCTMLQ